MVDMGYKLYRTRLRAAEAKKADLVDRGIFLGVRYVDPSDMVAEVWELYGDGRALVDPITRKAIVSSLLVDAGFQDSLGTIDLICDLIEKSFGVDITVDPTCELYSSSEKRLLELLRSYRDVISEKGLVELGEVIDVISKMDQLPEISIAEPLLVGEPLCRLFGDGGYPNTDDPTALLGDEVDIELLLSAGPSIKQAMMVDDVVDAAISKRYEKIAVACDNPLSFLEAISKCSKIERSTTVRFLASISPYDTDFGRTLTAMKGMNEVKSREAFIACATDLVLSPYLDVGRFTRADLYGSDPSQGNIATSSTQESSAFANLSRFDLNTIWRQDRTLDEDDIRSQISRISNIYASLSGLIELRSEDASIFDDLVALAMRRYDSDSLEKELSVLSRAKRVIEVLASFEVSFALSVDMVLGSNIRMSFMSEGDGEQSITILDHNSAADMMPESFDILYLDDISSRSFNSKEQSSSVDVLLEKMQRSSAPSAADVVSMKFNSIIKAAKQKLVLCFSLRNGSSEEEFLSFAFDDLVSNLSGAEMDGASLVSACIEGENVVFSNGRNIEYSLMGEEALQKGIGACAGVPADTLEVSAIERGCLSKEAIAHLLKSVEIDGKSAPILSASAVESYMGCPYRWFIEKRLNLGSVSDGMSALEVGNFLHRVLELFFKEVMQDSVAQGKLYRLSDEQIDDALARIYDEVLAEQRRLPAGKARYIPITEIERIKNSIQYDALRSSVKLMKGFPQDMSCTSSEFSFTAGECVDAGIDYAGAYLNGKIDRVDTSDDASRFCVVDYKGSIKDHCAGSDCFEVMDPGEGDSSAVRLDPDIYPNHIQVLIYSSLYERLRGLSGFDGRCVGSFYVSYKNTKGRLEITGSYPRSEEEFASMADKASIVDISFNDMLAAVEELVSVHVDRLVSGIISPNPHDKNICTYCSFRDCEARI